MTACRWEEIPQSRRGTIVRTVIVQDVTLGTFMFKYLYLNKLEDLKFKH
jgi:hypothetical protein